MIAAVVAHPCDWEGSGALSSRWVGVRNAHDWRVEALRTTCCGDRELIRTSGRVLYRDAFAGKDGGRMPEVSDYCFTVPSFSIHRIQESHVALLHILWDLTHVAMGEEDVI